MNRNMNVTMDPRYQEQMKILRSIAQSEGVVLLCPDYHATKGDCNTVLFYTAKDHAYNEVVIEQHFGNPPMDALKRPFFTFENTDVNGQFSYDFANRGKIDLRGLKTWWGERLRGHVKLSLLIEKQTDYIRSQGGIWNIREADQEYNDLNREIIDAANMAYGKIYLGNINYYGHQRERIVAGIEDVFKEYTGELVYNFGCCFCIPNMKDEKLRELIRQWNSAQDPAKGPVKMDPEPMHNRIHELGGFSFVWF